MIVYSEAFSNSRFSGSRPYGDSLQTYRIGSIGSSAFSIVMQHNMKIDWTANYESLKRIFILYDLRGHSLEDIFSIYCLCYNASKFERIICYCIFSYILVNMLGDSKNWLQILCYNSVSHKPNYIHYFVKQSYFAESYITITLTNCKLLVRLLLAVRYFFLYACNHVQIK